MPQRPNKLSQFWQELKRRRVVYVVTVYASAAFVIIELIGNLAEPLNLPPNLLTIVVIVLAVGFPLAIVLSWLYDVTSEGVEKTKAIEELKEGEKTVISNAWKIATLVSFVVIVGLASMNIIGRSGKLRSGDIQSILIMPFMNYTGDDQLDLIIAGMHSSLIGNVGRISNLKVISTTTANWYRKAGMTLSQIAAAAGVDAVVEPAVMCLGDSICFELNAITPDEEQLWFGEYHEAKSQIMNLQNRVTKEMADELKIELSANEELLLAETMTIDPEAFDAYMEGRSYLDLFSPGSWSVAIESFEKAIEIEPDWAAPYAGLAEVGTYMNQVGFGPESDRIRMIYENLNKSLDLDPNSAEAHHTNALTAAAIEFDWKKAEQEYLKAIELNPSFARSHGFYAHLLMWLRRTDEALYEGKLSVELDPENPFTLGLYVEVLWRVGRCQEALFYLEKALSIDPDHPFLIGGLTTVYECLGDYEKEFEVWKKIAYDRWEMMGGDVELLEEVFYEHGWIAFIQELIKLHEEAVAKGIQVTPGFFFDCYLTLGKYDKAMDYLEIIYENNPHNPSLPYYSAKSTYDKMKGNPRYLELLKKMNLPVSED